MGVSKVVYNKEAIVDLTGDTVTPETLAEGRIATNAAGEKIVGIMPLLTESANYPGCYYRTINNIDEWLSPPMVLGVEYRTIEKWNGKSVYTKLINCGKLSDKSISAIEHDASATQIIRCVGQDVTNGSSIPQKTNNNSLVDIEITADKTYVYITTSANCSSINAYAQIWYVKN